MCDSKGVINHKENLTQKKSDFIANTEIETLEDALKGADVFVGLSKGNVMTAEMLSFNLWQIILWFCAGKSYSRN